MVSTWLKDDLWQVAEADDLLRKCFSTPDRTPTKCEQRKWDDMTIALVDRVWHGHHPVYYRAFCEMLLELGHGVLAICPAPEEMASLADRAGGATVRLDAVRFAPPRTNIRPATFGAWIDCFLANQWIKKTLREWERAHREKISLVFYACIYDHDYFYAPRIAMEFPWPWSGLYLHCRSFRMPGTPIPQNQIVPRPERIFRHPMLQSVAIMDEEAVGYMKGVAHGLPVVVMPDFSDETPPSPGGIAEKLRSFAAGRPIVSLLGHLQASKGVATLAHVALDPANNDIIFAFAGELTGPFDEADRFALNRLKSAGNVFCHFQRVPGEASFNALVRGE